MKNAQLGNTMKNAQLGNTMKNAQLGNTMKNAQLVRAAKDFAKQPYAWPGGYPLVAIMNDAECMCGKCVKANFPQIARATRDKARDGWQVVGVTVNWESEDLTCGHCNAPIESAYGKD